MQRGIILMLSGWMQSGKDTVGAILCESFNFERFAFADALKDDVSEAFGIDRTSLDTSEGKEKAHDPKTGVTVRDVLITHGEEKRAEDAHHWVKKVARGLQQRMDNGSPAARVVITDWRFPSEFEGVEKHLGASYRIQTWRVNRFLCPPLSHSTETALDVFPFDVVIDNSADVGRLRDTVLQSVYAMNDSNVRILLTDVDETLLDWVHGFAAYARASGLTLIGDEPSGWDLSRWVAGTDGKMLSPGDVNELVVRFNTSPDFAHLRPCAGAVKALTEFRRAGWHVVALSSCTGGDKADVTFGMRVANLKMHFGGKIQKVICLPLGCSKRDALRAFPPSIWVDDNPRHVREGVDAGHMSFLMKRPWNTDLDWPGETFENWDEAVEHLYQGTLV